MIYGFESLKGRVNPWNVLSLFLFLVWSVYSNSFELKGMIFPPLIAYEKADGEVVSSSSVIASVVKGGSSRLAKIDYIFKVEGKDYFSNKINFAADGTKVNHYLRKYQKGDRVVVFYNVDDPFFSVLEPKNYSYRAFIGPVFIMALLIGYLFYCSKKKIDSSVRKRR